MARLGVMIEAQEGLNWERWRRIVADADRLGFASLRLSDHCQSLMGLGARESLQSWIALALAAEWSQRIELGPMVSPITFYQAGVLVRQAVAVDQLSNGRLLLGLGAGWNEAEHEAFGIPFPDIKERFRRLEDAIKRAEDLTARIPGARKLPLLLGGSGERRTLPLAARHATEWNAQGDAETFRQKSAVLDRCCRDIGRDPGEIRRSVMTSYVIGRTPEDLRERAVAMAEAIPSLQGMEPDEVLRTLGQRMAVGTPDQVASQLRAYADAGAELIMLQHFLLDDSDALELLMAEVAPALV
jgi:alkanesulfonate monooxygenase SsuD/methylene tetrahydromethanopterin reductase-like flavin-dependent oxidoreductase (luciferase family)